MHLAVPDEVSTPTRTPLRHDLNTTMAPNTVKLLACALASGSAFHIAPQQLSVPSHHLRTPAPVALVDVPLQLLAADAPVMADGAGAVAVAGGLVMILTAGIPVLFLSKEKDNAAHRAAGLEEGLKSEMGEAAFDEAMMEEVEMEDETPSPAADADKKTGMI